MFIGRYQHKVENKGRVALPIKLREAGKGLMFSEFVATKGIGGCIALFPVDKFESFIENFDPTSTSDQESLDFYREFASWAHYVQIDAQGRVSIPAILLEEAHVSEEALILGVVDWIEIWEPRDYRKYLETNNTSYDKGALGFFKGAIRGAKKGTNGTCNGSA